MNTGFLFSSFQGGVVPNSYVYVDSGNGRGSTNTGVRRYSNTRANIGSDITYADSATNGATFTINTTGIYYMVIGDASATGIAEVGVVVNGTALTTATASVTYAQGRRAAATAPLGLICSTGAVLRLVAGDILYPSVSANNSAGDQNAYASVIRIA